jgi:hypothetical protein
MKAFRGSVLAALVLLSALVVVVSPAFATPNLTASSGNDLPLSGAHSRAAVAPFITPSTNTRSLYTGLSTDSSFSIPSLGAVLTCREAHVSGYASTTHTQIRLTSVSFGNIADSRNCTSNIGTIDVQPITCTATSRVPWYLHARVANAATRSASGTVNLTSSCTIRMTIGGAAQVISVDANQSCRVGARSTGVFYTWTAPPSILVDCEVQSTLRGVVTASAATQFRGTYTIRPDTRRDATLTVTATS